MLSRKPIQLSSVLPASALCEKRIADYADFLAQSRRERERRRGSFEHITSEYSHLNALPSCVYTIQYTMYSIHENNILCLLFIVCVFFFSLVFPFLRHAKIFPAVFICMVWSLAMGKACWVCCPGFKSVPVFAYQDSLYHYSMTYGQKSQGTGMGVRYPPPGVFSIAYIIYSPC